jgi:hypothetical protein
MRYERVFRYNILRAIRWSTTTVPSIFAHTKSLNVPAACASFEVVAACACVVLFGVSVGSVVA